MPGKKFIALFILFSVITFSTTCTTSFAADNGEEILKRWTHETTANTKEGDQEIRISATYYSNEYVEALVASEAEKNLWTADETENYKYTLLKNLNLAEAIPFHISILVRGIPMYLQPFDRHITMMIGRKKYTPIDYDKRFNFKLQGTRNGMVFFPRYDPQTGKEVLAGARDIRLVFDSAPSIALSSRGDVIWVWDLAKDRGKVGGGKAANRLEIDRLIKRLNKLDDDRNALRRQLDALDKEYNEVNSRIDELQSQ